MYVRGRPKPKPSGENVAFGNHFAIMMNAQQLTSFSIHHSNGLYTFRVEDNKIVV